MSDTEIAASRIDAQRFVKARRAIFAIMLASYVLSFVHRTAPAAIANELTQAFAINATVLGTLAATYFYVYTLLQIPVGVLADTVGPRRLVAGGSLLAGIGSLAFALAPTWEIAATGRTLLGVGVAVAFIAVLKISAVWFPANRFATLNGFTLFAGNLGAVAAGAPLAWLVTWMSWRAVFAALALLSFALALATWLKVRDRPEDLGFARVHAPAPDAAAQVPWTSALLGVVLNPRTWPGFFVNIGIAGSYLAFAGLWAVPFLQQAYGMTRVTAAEHASLLLLGVAIGSIVIGVISDRLRNRSAVMRAYTLLYALAWWPWLVQAQWPVAATMAWCFAMGLVTPGFVLTWTVAKEVNRPEHAGTATSVVNVGVFLGTGMLQPLVGWLLDRARAGSDPTRAWDLPIGVLAASAVLGAAASWLVRERAPPRGR